MVVVAATPSVLPGDARLMGQQEDEEVCAARPTRSTRDSFNTSNKQAANKGSCCKRPKHLLLSTSSTASHRSPTLARVNASEARQASSSTQRSIKASCHHTSRDSISLANYKWLCVCGRVPVLSNGAAWPLGWREGREEWMKKGEGWGRRRFLGLDDICGRRRVSHVFLRERFARLAGRRGG